MLLKTGHLVFGTLHSQNATLTIGRILDFFPEIRQSGKNEGMQDFEDSLLDLYNREFIDKETALKYAENPHSFEMKMKGIFLAEEGGIVL